MTPDCSKERRRGGGQRVKGGKEAEREEEDRVVVKKPRSALFLVPTALKKRCTRGTIACMHASEAHRCLISRQVEAGEQEEESVERRSARQYGRFIHSTRHRSMCGVVHWYGREPAHLYSGSKMDSSSWRMEGNARRQKSAKQADEAQRSNASPTGQTRTSSTIITRHTHTHTHTHSSAPHLSRCPQPPTPTPPQPSKEALPSLYSSSSTVTPSSPSHSPSRLTPRRPPPAAPRSGRICRCRAGCSAGRGARRRACDCSRR